VWKESSEAVVKLKTGLTTGACATACCVGAAQLLLAKQQIDVVSITLPKGKTVELNIVSYVAVDGAIKASTIKDAGDDPDATHGATVFVELTLTSNLGVAFSAAQGVGTVTKEGLLLEVGEPAINPVPRAMMTEHLLTLAKQYNYQGGFLVAVGVENGESIALKTMNGRLGIVGGLSILGTTGIVRPFSCAAWIASIYQGIDVAHANGLEHIAATTGNSSEDAIKRYYQLDDMALIEMGDFAGAVLKHLKKVPVNKLTICGGIGKISKLANGHMDLNSRASDIDFLHLATVASEMGADKVLIAAIQSANTSVQALQLCQQKNIDLANALCHRALVVAQKIVPINVNVEVVAIDRKGQFVGSTSAEIMAGLR
jgi:cobalt-precorrin-5B (C1)-methyltransferase